MAEQSPDVKQTFQDYNQVLHLHAEADAAMVDQAYWHLARLYNAAIASDPLARRRLDELNEAYGVLRSPVLRRQYDEVRDAVLGEGALPLPSEPEPEPEPPPLAVMSKQKPKAREEEKKTKVRRRLHIFRMGIPPWQNAAGSLIILLLGVLALVAGVNPAFVAALLIFGVAFMVIPLVRQLPRLPAVPTPTLHLPSVRAPRLPQRPSGRATADADTVRQSTEAMVHRWRAGRSASDAPPPMRPVKPEAAVDAQPSDNPAADI